VIVLKLRDDSALAKRLGVKTASDLEALLEALAAVVVVTGAKTTASIIAELEMRFGLLSPRPAPPPVPIPESFPPAGNFEPTGSTPTPEPTPETTAPPDPRATALALAQRLAELDGRLGPARACTDAS
jgi:predicted Zn-dependent peptidase